MADFTVETYSVVLAPNRAKVILYESEDITPDTRRVVLLLEPGAVGGPVEDDGTRVTAHMRLSMLDKLVDLLRNEEPVRVVWWPTHAYVYAGPEPVGEGEQGQIEVTPLPLPAITEPAGGGGTIDNMHPFTGLHAIIALAGVFPSRNGGGAGPGTTMIGEIKWVPYPFAPRGWALCNGQLLAISQNSALFSLIGTTYGGDGRTTFALPDLRGRSVVHAGTGPGLTGRALGERGGSETHTLTVDQLAPQAHAIAQPDTDT